MSRPAFTLALCALCLALTPAFAAEPATGIPATADPAATAAPAPDSLPAAIADALAQERAQVETLAAQLATAPDDATALALQKAVEQAKFDGQVRVLTLQAAFARREGRLDDATRIEAALGAMGRPAVPAHVEERPVPVDSPSGR